MRVASTNDERELAGFFGVNGLKADEGGHYVMTRGSMNGKRETESDTSSTSSRAGKLRFVRKGDRLHFLAAEDEHGPFQRLRSIEFTTDDVSSVRLGVQAVDLAKGMEVCWKDLVVRAEGIEGLPSDVQVAEPTRSEYRPPLAESGSGNWWWFAVAGLMILLCGVGVWWWVSTRKKGLV